MGIRRMLLRIDGIREGYWHDGMSISMRWRFGNLNWLDWLDWIGLYHVSGMLSTLIIMRRLDRVLLCEEQFFNCVALIIPPFAITIVFFLRRLVILPLSIKVRVEDCERTSIRRNMGLLSVIFEKKQGYQTLKLHPPLPQSLLKSQRNSKKFGLSSIAQTQNITS